MAMHHDRWCKAKTPLQPIRMFSLIFLTKDNCRQKYHSLLFIEEMGRSFFFKHQPPNFISHSLCSLAMLHGMLNLQFCQVNDIAHSRGEKTGWSLPQMIPTHLLQKRSLVIFTLLFWDLVNSSWSACHFFMSTSYRHPFIYLPWSNGGISNSNKEREVFPRCTIKQYEAPFGFVVFFFKSTELYSCCTKKQCLRLTNREISESHVESLGTKKGGNCRKILQLSRCCCPSLFIEDKILQLFFSWAWQNLPAFLAATFMN